MLKRMEHVTLKYAEIRCTALYQTSIYHLEFFCIFVQSKTLCSLQIEEIRKTLTAIIFQSLTEIKFPMLKIPTLVK